VSEISRDPTSMAAIVSLTATLACAPRPSDGRCEAMVDHVVALMRASHDGRAADIAGGVAQERHATLLERCLSDGTAAEVECVLGAETLDEIQACAPRP
jgi:hypothetical protein